MRHHISYSPDDYALSFQRGEEKALSWFFTEFYAPLCTYATQFTNNEAVAQEIVSEAYVKTWKLRGQFTKAGSIRAYLYTIVRHDSVKWHKREHQVVKRYQNNDTIEDAYENNAFEAIVKAEVARYLHQSINMLPPRCRQIFQLLYIEGKSIPEVAELLQLKQSTVRSHKLLGLDTLRRKIILSFALFFIWLIQ